MKKEKLIKVEKVRTNDNGLTWVWGIVGQQTTNVYYSADRISCCMKMHEDGGYYEKLEEEEIIQDEIEMETAKELQELQASGMEAELQAQKKENEKWLEEQGE